MGGSLFFLFPDIYSGPCRFLYLGEIERRSEATQKVKKKKNLPASLSIPPNKVFHLTCVSGRALHGSFRRSGFSFPSLFFFLFSSLFFPPPQVALPHNNILSPSLTCLPSPSCLRLSPIKSIEREKRKNKNKKKMEKRNRRWWWWYMLYKKKISKDYRAGNKARLTGSLFSRSSTHNILFFLPIPLLHNAPTCAYFIFRRFYSFAPYSRHTTYNSSTREKEEEEK